MFDFDVVTGPNRAESLRRTAEKETRKEKPAAGLAPTGVAPLSSEPQDPGDRGK